MLFVAFLSFFVLPWLSPLWVINVIIIIVPASDAVHSEEEEEEEEFITSGNWRGKHNSLSRGAGADQP